MPLDSLDAIKGSLHAGFGSRTSLPSSRSLKNALMQKHDCRRKPTKDNTAVLLRHGRTNRVGGFNAGKKLCCATACTEATHLVPLSLFSNHCITKETPTEQQTTLEKGLIYIRVNLTALKMQSQHQVWDRTTAPTPSTVLWKLRSR